MEDKLISANKLLEELNTLPSDNYVAFWALVAKQPAADIYEELKFTREFIHRHGLEFALASEWENRNK